MLGSKKKEILPIKKIPSFNNYIKSWLLSYFEESKQTSNIPFYLKKKSTYTSECQICKGNGINLYLRKISTLLMVLQGKGKERLGYRIL